ncbi:MAG TPA: hypothetical protein VMV89_03295 [Candidatus Paceibacterota bacterium]|nr:hypothetical protein [Candidatus Paceibacterota bacterium]
MKPCGNTKAWRPGADQGVALAYFIAGFRHDHWCGSCCFHKRHYWLTRQW